MKVILRKILESPGLGFVRFIFWKSLAKRDSDGSRRIAAEGGYLSLDYSSSFFSLKTPSNDLFILGSGSSVNELSTTALDEISNNVSIGINAWPLHSFVPTAYSFETGQDGDQPSEETKFVTSLVQQKTVLGAAPKFLFLRPTPPATVSNLVQTPKRFQQARTMYGRTNLITKLPRNLEQDLTRIVRAGSRGKIPKNVLLDNGASVVRLIFFGAMQGFRKVVLVGIDLDDKPYFWDAEGYPDSDPAASRILSRPKGTLHNSMETLDRPFSVDAVIVALSAVLERELGTIVAVGSRASSLAGRLPVHRWATEP